MSYWYLATPYALYPGGKQSAYEEARDQTAKLMLLNIPIYSRIVHNHPLSLLPEMFMKGGKFDFWVEQVDKPLMEGAGGLLVCMLDGWQISKGIQYEIAFFKSQQKPIYYYDPLAPIIQLPILSSNNSDNNDSKFIDCLNSLSHRCREANDTWWRDPITGEKITRNKGELIALMHSELSECLEGVRKGLQDDHLPQYPMELVELADTLVRIFDYIGEFYPVSENDNGINLGNAFEEKMKYNAQRSDHKPENRVKDKGKVF